MSEERVEIREEGPEITEEEALTFSEEQYPPEEEGQEIEGEVIEHG